MKRIGRWLLILAATTCLTCNNNVNALKATSIIFGKVPNSLTTTTTTTTAPGTNSTVDQLITDKNEVKICTQSKTFSIDNIFFILGMQMI